MEEPTLLQEKFVVKNNGSKKPAKLKCKENNIEYTKISLHLNKNEIRFLQRKKRVISILLQISK